MYSKTHKFRSAIPSIFLLLLFASFAAAQEIEVRFSFTAPVETGQISVEGKFLDAGNAPKRWSFLQNYADAANLGARIENLRLFGANGAEIPTKKLVAGEFEAENAAVSFRYDVKTEIAKELTAAAHVSWLSAEHGLLMTGDLLPENLQKLSARIVFEMPSGWRVTTSENKTGENVFAVKNAEKAIFLVGKNWREQSAQINETRLNFATAGEWQFTDAEALKMAEQILAEHRKIFGEIPFSNAQIVLLPFPQTANFDRWRAETRGSTVVIITAPTAFKSAALNRLHEQLRHELFHFWTPNSLNLSGNYDWFYEGFTLYQALKTGVRLNQIRFDDFLSTLGRAYDLTEALSRRQTVSLIEASNKRWINSNELIYAKGIVVAFLCDAALLGESRGKRDLDTIFREIFQTHRAPNQREDGNAVILRILKRNAELTATVEKYVEGNSKIDWQNDLADYGLTAEKVSGATQIKVVAKPNGRQKDLLDKLGYNQWRKLLRQQR